MMFGRELGEVTLLAPIVDISLYYVIMITIVMKAFVKML